MRAPSARQSRSAGDTTAVAGKTIRGGSPEEGERPREITPSPAEDHTLPRVCTHTWRPKGEPGGLGRGKRIVEHQKSGAVVRKAPDISKSGHFSLVGHLFWGVLGLVCLVPRKQSCSAFGSANGGSIVLHVLRSRRRFNRDANNAASCPLEL